MPARLNKGIRTLLLSASIAVSFSQIPPLTAQPATSAVTAALPLNVLADKEAIREQWARYVMLLNGDTISPPDPKRWANELFTENATYQGYGPSGQPMFGNAGLKGRDDIATAFENGWEAGLGAADSIRAKNVGAKAYRLRPMDIVFDELTPTRAVTRTAGFIVIERQNTPPPVPGYSPAIVVFHDTWTKTADGWKKSSSVARYLTIPDASVIEDKVQPLPQPPAPTDSCGGSGTICPNANVLNHHYATSFVFDEITPTTAKVRAVIGIWRGQPNRAVQNVPAGGLGATIYWDNWRVEDGIWKKSKSVLRSPRPIAGAAPVGRAGADAATPPGGAAAAGRGGRGGRPDYGYEVRPAPAPDSTVIAKGMSLEDVLNIKETLRQRWADYDSTLDGDGLLPQCGTDRWGPALFTKDGTFQGVGADGKLTYGPGEGLVGLAKVSATFGGGMEPFPPCASKPARLSGAPLQGVAALSAKYAIREQLSKYAMLQSGDGESKPDLANWANMMFTTDATFQSYSFGSGGPLFNSTLLTGRAEIANYFSQPPKDPRITGRWFDVYTSFDELTADEARTRTMALYFSGPVSPDAAPPPTDFKFGIFHDTWRHTSAGWQKEKSELR